MSIIEGKSIEIEIRFVRAFKATGRVIMKTKSLSDDQKPKCTGAMPGY
jgi:hypothetical protein